MYLTEAELEALLKDGTRTIKALGERVQQLSAENSLLVRIAEAANEYMEEGSQGAADELEKQLKRWRRRVRTSKTPLVPDSDKQGGGT